MLDRILVQRAETMSTTKGGIVLPEKAQGKMMHGTVVAVGPGGRNSVSCYNCVVTWKHVNLFLLF